MRDSWPSLRDDLDRLWSAGLVAEFLTKASGGGGDYPLVLSLALQCLAALDSCPGGETEPPLLQFLWRFVELLGIGPDPTACSSCGAQLRPSLGGGYSFALEGFLCPSCASRAERSLPLGTGTLRWLTRVLELSFADAMRLVVLPETLATLKVLIFGLARSAAEAPLLSLESGNLDTVSRPR